MDKLPYKERAAIELRYLGNSHSEIAEKIETPMGTVEGWFKSDGKLYSLYNSFVADMNQKRQKNLEEKLAISDDEAFTLTTNIWRRVSQRVQGVKVPVRDSKGNVVLDANNQPVMVDEVLDVDVADAERAWKMQRVMRNLPTSYEKQDVEQTNYESDVIIKALGLTDEDFNDDNIGATTKKISEYLASH